MLSMQHYALAVLHDDDDDPRTVGAIVFPDAIRAYLPREIDGKKINNRVLSHYERFDDGSDGSWWSMPASMADVTPESVAASVAAGAHLADNAARALRAEDRRRGLQGP